MKKLLTLLTILSLSCTLLCISGCEDSGDSVYVDEGRLVSDVVINTSMDVFKGMEVPIEGQGFESGDQMMLRAETDLEATTEVSSSNLLTFTLPDEIEDGHTYKFVLLRGDDYQVLGASTLTVKLVIKRRARRDDVGLVGSSRRHPRRGIPHDRRAGARPGRRLA